MKKDKEKEEIDEQEKDLNNPQEPESEDNSNEGAADEETQEATDPLEAANKQIAELNDKFLRKVAEFDNYRKRTLKEKADLILNGDVEAYLRNVTDYRPLDERE